jgi:WD40 repeat protein/serine/threonine protein kinase
VDVKQLPETETADASPKNSVGDAFHPGTRVDHFKVIRLVGRGGMGEVYLARDTQLGRKVALKVIQPERLGSKRAVKQFLQEARATATFSHPHIVTIHTTGEHEGRPYVALEYLEGRNLRKRMEDHPPSLRETLRLGLAIAEALAEAHRRHILHRDLKPENVVLPKDGRLRVVDFGLAKLIQNQAGILDTLTPPMAFGLNADASPGFKAEASPDADTASLPETQAPVESLAKGVRGTPEYMSPEQWRDEPVTPAIDVWALGVILYELVAGQRPYGEASFFGLAFKVGAEEPVPPLPNLNELPTDVVELIHACLDKEDKKRPSAQEVVSSLQGMIAAWGRSEEGTGEANPFRGLQPFTEEHADLFFGRDAEVNAFLERLREETVLPVVGPSGAGKSSFVQAGVVPRLREQEPWTVLQLRPGRRPFRALAHRLLAGELRRGKTARSLPSLGGRVKHASSGRTKALRYSREDVRKLSTLLKESPGLLSLRLRELAETSEGNVLLVVDQLEELVTMVPDVVEQQLFMEALCTAVDDPLSPTRVLFTLRDDFMVRLALGSAAREVLSHVTVLRRPEPENLEETLRSPVERLGYRYDDPALIGEMVEQVKGEPACLPLLQFTASLLWERRDRAKRLLCRAHHDEIGGVAGALARNADGLLDELAGARAKLAREILLRLVTADGTRRVIPRVQLLDGLDPEGAADVLNRLVTGRLLTVRRGWQEEGEEAEIELVHESLVKTWSQLARWVDESREDLTFLAEVGHAADLWHRRGRLDEALWRGEQLHEAMRSRTRCTTQVPERVTAFIEAGLSRERGAQRRKRIGSVAVVAALAVLAAVFFWLWMGAQQQQRLAEEQRGIARKRWAEAQREGARAALAQGDPLEARAKVRGSLEQEDSPLARALWWRLGRLPLRWRGNVGSTVWSVAFSSDGRTLASGTDEAIYLRDLQSHKTRVVRHAGDQIRTLAFSPDKLHLAAGSTKGVVRLWNLERDTSIRLAAHTQTVWRMAFSRDGKTLATAANDKRVILWDVTSGAERLRLPPQASPVFGLAFSADGGRLFTGNLASNTITVWSAANGARLAELKPKNQAPPLPGLYDFSVAPDGRTLAVAESKGDVRLWDLTARPPRMTGALHGHTDTVYHVAFSPDGKRLVSSDLGGTVRLWDPSRREARGTYQAQNHSIFGLAVHPNSRWIATGARKGEVRLLDMSIPWPQPPEGHDDCANDVAFSSDGKTIASSSRDHTVRIWDRNTGRQIKRLTGHKDIVLGLDFGPGRPSRIIADGAKSRSEIWLASASRDGTIRIWDPLRGKQERVIFSAGPLDNVAFHPSGRLVTGTGGDRYVRVWDLTTASLPRSLAGHHDVALGAVFSPDGRLLASSSYGGKIMIWNLASGRAIRSLEGHTVAVRNVAFSPDGKTLGSADTSGEIRLWNLASGAHRVLGRHPGRIYSVVFHPGGELLGVPHPDGTARLWRIADGSYTELRGHRADVNNMSFSPNGEVVATGSDDTTVRLWDVATTRPIWRTTALLGAPARTLSHQGWRMMDGSPAVKHGALGATLRRRLEREVSLGVEARPGGRVCIKTHAGRLELWEPGDDRELLSKPVSGIKRLLALQRGGCAFWDGKQAGLYLPSGSFKQLHAEASALGRSGDHLLVATGKKFLTFDANGRQVAAAVSISAGVTALTRTKKWLVLGFKDGTIERLPLGQAGAVKRPSHHLEEVPSSEVVRLLPGPMKTVIAGFANGVLGIWNLENGALLFQQRLHGAMLHLLLDRDKLHAATDLGRQVTLDLSVFTQPRCQVLRQVWAGVSEIWEGGLPVRREPDSAHPCSARER